MKDFDSNYILRTVGPSLWQAFNRHTNKAASPRYTSKDAAIYYVEQELKQEMEETIDLMLGGSGVITRAYDDDSLCGRLPNAVSRNGTKEIK